MVRVRPPELGAQLLEVRLESQLEARGFLGPLSREVALFAGVGAEVVEGDLPRLVEQRHLEVPIAQRGLGPSAALVVREVEHQPWSWPRQPRSWIGQQWDEARPLEVSREPLPLACEVSERGQEVEAHHRLVTPGVRLDAGRPDDEGDADAPLPQATLAAVEQPVPAPAGAVVRRVDDDRRVVELQPVQRRHQPPHAFVQVLGQGRALEVLVAPPTAPRLHALERRGASILGVVEGVERELGEERAPVGLGLLHEGLRPLHHPEDVHGVGVHERGGVAVARVTVMGVVAVVSGPSAGEVPLAKVSRGVPRLLEHLPHGDLCLRERPGADRRDQSIPVVGRHGPGRLGPAQPRRTLARLDRGSRRRADGGRRVPLGEAHARGGELGDPGGPLSIVGGPALGGVHGDREPAPALVIREDQQDVRTLGEPVSRRRGGGSGRRC